MRTERTYKRLEKQGCIIIPTPLKKKSPVNPLRKSGDPLPTGQFLFDRKSVLPQSHFADKFYFGWFQRSHTVNYEAYIAR